MWPLWEESGLAETLTQSSHVKFASLMNWRHIYNREIVNWAGIQKTLLNLYHFQCCQPAISSLSYEHTFLWICRSFTWKWCNPSSCLCLLWLVKEHGEHGADQILLLSRNIVGTEEHSQAAQLSLLGNWYRVVWMPRGYRKGVNQAMWKMHSTFSVSYRLLHSCCSYYSLVI